jgi:hypothetical protein
MTLGPESRRRRSRAALRVGGLAVVLATPVVVYPQEISPGLRSFLETRIHLGSGDLRSLERGKPVAKELQTADRRDVVMIGAVRVNASRSSIVDQLGRLDFARHVPGRTGFGVFGTPATPADFTSLSLSDDDIAHLRKCEPGSCMFKMPATTMMKLRSIIDSAGPAPNAQLTAYVATKASEYVNEYRTRGRDAMVVYDDHAKGSVAAATAFGELIGSSPYLLEYIPAFYRHLVNYPKDTLAGVSDAIFWARDELKGLRSTLTLNHVSIYSPPDHPRLTIVGTKQIFASHYFEAAFDLLAIVEDEGREGSGRGVTILIIRHFRFDHMPGRGILNVRGRISGKLRERTEEELSILKREYEALPVGRLP